MDLEDRHPSRHIRYSYLDLTIEATSPPQCRIQIVGKVCCCYHNDPAPALEPVHQRQELCNDTTFNLPFRILPLGCYRVYLINEDDRGGMLLGFLKNLTKFSFTLPVIFVHDLGA